MHNYLSLVTLAAFIAVNLTSIQACSDAWGQCGGIGFTGSTCCGSGYVCQKQNDYYSQCIPSTTRDPSCSNALYGQCGGIGYTGLTCCPAGSSCVKSDNYYSQCRPSSSTQATSGTTVSTTKSSPTTTKAITTTKATTKATTTKATTTKATTKATTTKVTTIKATTTSTKAASTTTVKATTTLATTKASTTISKPATTSTKASTTTTKASATTVSCSGAYGQCGGTGFTGPICCIAGYSCQYSNAYYSQCLPGAASITTTGSKTTTKAGSTTTTKAGTTVIPKTSFNYAEVLGKSLTFFYGQMSGKISGTFNTLTWRGDSALQDGSDNSADLTGGYYDAGDHVKFGLPMSYSMYMLALSGLHHESTYRATGSEWQRLLNVIKWGTDYFLRCHTSTYVFYGQVGRGDLDHSWWGPPEKMTMQRPSFKITSSAPGSELAGSVAATFALSSFLFRSVNKTYSDLLLTHARQMFDFATKYQGSYVNAISDARSYYNSYSGYKDEQLLGALALYWATNETTYRTYAYDNSRSLVKSALSWAPGWDDASYANVYLLWKLMGDLDARNVFETWANYFMNNVQKTPQGMVYLTTWGSARYPPTVAFLLLCYVDSNPSLAATKAASYLTFTLKQVNYILGNNTAGFSYLVGFGNKWAQHYHHRAAQGSLTNNMYDPPVNKYVNYELVGGPDSNDGYEDSILNYAQSEGACDMQVGLIGVAAALVKRYGGTALVGFP